MRESVCKRCGRRIGLVPWGLHYKWVSGKDEWKCNPTAQFPVRSHDPEGKKEAVTVDKNQAERGYLRFSVLFAAWAAQYIQEDKGRIASLQSWLDQHPALTEGLTPITSNVLNGGLHHFLDHVEEISDLIKEIDGGGNETESSR